MLYSTDTLTDYIAANALKVCMIMHDDFTHHETYVLATNSESKVFTLVYVGPDDALDVVEHDSRLSAMCYLIQVAEHTFHVVDEEGDETISLMRLGRDLRANAIEHIAHNVDEGFKNFLKKEHITALL